MNFVISSDRILITLIFVNLLRYATSLGSWVNLGMQGLDVWKTSELYMIGAQPLCTQIPGLSPGQAKFCLLYLDHMKTVSSGAQLGISECQWQFLYSRWNCSTVKDSSVFGRVIQTASMEAAFTHAITAAGVVHAVSRSCRDGQLSSCRCSKARRPRDLNLEWKWGGCGDNIEYGYKFTEGFVDVRERERNFRRGSKQHGRKLMNLHNNEAGRRAVIRKTRVTCKCHGVSGSCSMVTCWQQLAPFREVGLLLKQKYANATKVKVNRRGRLQIINPNHVLPTAEDLVYIQDSPDYCVANKTTGSLGTRGRMCNKDSPDIDGCQLLCCGRGYNTEKVIIKKRCNCRFHWCCHVECKMCRERVLIHTCK